MEKDKIEKQETNQTSSNETQPEKQVNQEEQVKQEEQYENVAPNWKEFREFKKQLKQLKEERHKSIVKEEFLKQGGKSDYFDDFYAGNRFDKTEDLKKAMEDVKSKKTIYFNKISFSGIESFAKKNNINVESEKEDLSVSNFKNILDRKS